MKTEVDFEVEDLGAASIETKGPPSAHAEFGGQLGNAGQPWSMKAERRTPRYTTIC